MKGKYQKKFDLPHQFHFITSCSSCTCSAFRQLHQELNGSPFPINIDGTPVIRCTKNPYILKIEINKLLKEKNC